jgi:hypothetical protein
MREGDAVRALGVDGAVCEPDALIRLHRHSS